MYYINEHKAYEENHSKAFNFICYNNFEFKFRATAKESFLRKGLSNWSTQVFMLVSWPSLKPSQNLVLPHFFIKMFDLIYVSDMDQRGMPKLNIKFKAQCEFEFIHSSNIANKV